MPGSLTGRYLSDELRIQMPTDSPQTGTAEDQDSRRARAQSEKRSISTSLWECWWRSRASRGRGNQRCCTTFCIRPLAAAKKQTNGIPLHLSVLGRRSDGDEYIDEVVLVDQSPIGRTPRSNPVTYIKAFDGIRDLFAVTPEATEARDSPPDIFRSMSRADAARPAKAMER